MNRVNSSHSVCCCLCGREQFYKVCSHVIKSWHLLVGLADEAIPNAAGVTGSLTAGSMTLARGTCSHEADHVCEDGAVGVLASAGK